MLFAINGLGALAFATLSAIKSLGSSVTPVTGH